MIGTTFLCTIAFVVDSDTIACSTGQRVRIAAVSGLERNGSCNSRPWCATMPYAQARRVVERITLGRTYRFTVYGRSGKRIVADNPALRCQLISTGAVVSWESYRVRYRLGRCP